MLVCFNGMFAHMHMKLITPTKDQIGNPEYMSKEEVKGSMTGNVEKCNQHAHPDSILPKHIELWATRIV